MIIPKANRLSHVKEYYFARKLAEVRALVAEGKPIINLGIGDPDQAPSAETLEALVDTAKTPGTNGYQSYTGIPALRQAMASWYKSTYGVELNPEKEVLPLMGSKEGILHTSLAFLNPGDKVLVPNPGYPAYATATRLAGAEPIFYTLSEENGWLPQQEELERLATEGVKIMWINYPHMPTGAQATSEKLRELVNFARANSILLINDNPYSLVLPGAQPLSILSIEGATDCCLELNSLSKSHNMAGWRVGMVLGQQDYLAAILAVKSNMDSGMYLPIQKAAIAALQNNEAWHEERNEVYAERKQLAHQLLDALHCKYQPNTVGMFVWAKVPEQVADVEAYLDQLLYEQHLFLTPGKIFGSQGERYLRISLCAPAAQLTEAINRIKKHHTLTV
ncbi:pyridoxal phosphate-dependent aminotransferase [Pontibacter harenae]|uniref:pyridoxal phosphate-dependent aminotransferase n=1 Tax=Pontibacter harenae TaxID=2894083 RepID=UPI001E502EF3|nr:aminotransferase class I/II-fold pyridoxal phosphate-dependent enzyme [Pontibacter harenae]MCC9167141.1 aminotransferase class I/II-fold pyridoxal phosphate-dependent enzyme [Pontibacter harenae]